MATRRELKTEARERLAAEKAARRARAAELAAMPADERRAAKAADRAAAKHAKADRKRARAAMTREERRADSRREKAYRRAKNRTRTLIVWAIVLVVALVIGVTVAPFVRDIQRVSSITLTPDTPAGEAARANSVAVAEKISDEGLVLLENDGALPLASPRLNVFSFASFNLRFGGGGSGGSAQTTSVPMYEAFADQGIEVNAELQTAMQDAGAKTENGPGNFFAQMAGMLTGASKKSEPTPDYLTESVLAQAREFSGTALVVIGNDGAEATDMPVEALRLTTAQRELMDVVTANFDDVIVVINSGNQMELGFLEEYEQVTGAVWIGTPGPRGAVSLAKVLTGEVNPSGHLSDTYAYDIASAPSVENFGNFAYENVARGLYEYEEGIYIGYRYYETRYADDEAAYQKAVQYPFGFGRSYTEFDWNVAPTQLVEDTVSTSVTVTNTGNVPGRDVVQVYFSAPYTPGGLEKSAIVLGGYAKTGELAPGESETVTVTFAERDMASWDTANGGAYVLDAGTYVITVGTDIHSPVATANLLLEAQRYTTDAVTGTALTNQFGYAEGDLTYLSRDDWEGTYPDGSDVETIASDELLAYMNPVFEPVAGEAPTQGVDNGILLADLKGRDYDDPMWEDFLDQFTVEELIEVFARGGYLTEGVERVGMPASVLLDGPAGLNYLFGNLAAASFPTAVVVASTWNDALAEELGEAVGAEANAYGVHGWYAPGQNLHRSPQGGRGFEYFSEDPLLSGKMSAGMTRGAQSKNVLTFMKHFVVNDQETNARSGVNLFLSEQAMRELYLKPFEITVKEADATGAMSSFINIGGRWAGGSEALQQNVLRGEWGFTGIVTSDAVLGGFMDPALAVRYGNDLMLSFLGTITVNSTADAYKADPVGVGHGLRDRVHAVAYGLLQTTLFP